jgi:hypothetical protein
MNTIKIHVAPGVAARAAARDLLKSGAVGIDDIGENLHDLVSEEILDELGNAGDGIDLRTQRVDTPIGPVFVLRIADVWSAAEAKKAVLAANRHLVRSYGRPYSPPLPQVLPQPPGRPLMFSSLESSLNHTARFPAWPPSTPGVAPWTCQEAG